MFYSNIKFRLLWFLCLGFKGFQFFPLNRRFSGGNVKDSTINKCIHFPVTNFHKTEHVFFYLQGCRLTSENIKETSIFSDGCWQKLSSKSKNK